MNLRKKSTVVQTEAQACGLSRPRRDASGSEKTWQESDQTTNNSRSLSEGVGGFFCKDNLMIKIFKYRAYPTEKQGQVFQQWFGCMRFIYNYGLEKKIDSYQKQVDEGVEKPKSLPVSEISKQITEMKKSPEYEWLAEPPADSIVYELKNLDAAFKNFYRRIKNGETPGFPKFKAKYQSRKSFKFRRTTINEEAGYIYVPKAGQLKVVFHRPVEGDHYELSRTLIQEPSGRYYISIMADDGKPERENTPCDYDHLVGVDHGVVQSLTLSDGAIFDIDLNYPLMNKRLDLLHKRLSRKKRGSNNRQKARKRLARQYEKIRHKRKYDIENLVVDLVAYLKENDYCGVVIRKYDIKSILKKIEPVKGENGYEKNGREVQKKINRKIAGSGLGFIYRQINYKLPESGLHVFEIDSSGEKTTAKCSNCGEKEAFMVQLSSRKTRCENCGESMNMDLNAARNTLSEFLNDKMKTSEAV